MRITQSTFFGKEGSAVFNKEAWRFFQPQIESVISSHTSLGAEGQLVYLDRKGYLEECYLDYNLEPIMIGDVVQGVFCTFIESTKRVINTRRMELLTELCSETLKAQSVSHGCSIISAILNRFNTDVPFNLTYLLKTSARKDQLCSFGLNAETQDLFDSIDVSDEIKYIEGLKNNVSKAVLIPIKNLGQGRPFVMMILGISPSIELDEDYKSFHLLMARFLTTILTKIQMIEAKQKDLVARDEFISLASHEFKTPITALKLRLALTKRKIDLDNETGPTPAEMIECIKTANQQADRLTDLVDELLDMTRIQRGKFQFTYEDVDIKDLIDEVLERFEEELKASGNKVSIEIDCKDHAHWHRSRIVQALCNLMNNSIKYAPHSEIKIAVKQDKHQFQIEYSDNGPGIPKEKQDSLFEKFDVGHSSQRLGGLGLGLYIVREIIKGHSGNIQLISSDKSGTKFLITLPTKPGQLKTVA